MATGLLKKSLVALFIILLIIIVLNKIKTKEFNREIYTKFIKEDLSFPYYLKFGHGDFLLALGDLNGLNKDAYNGLLGLTRGSYPENRPLIIIPSLMPGKSESLSDKITDEGFLGQVSNSRGIVIVDNFCTSNWESVKEKVIYASSSLSPGPYCLSEAEAIDLNNIIKKYHVASAVLVYDTDRYIDFISNFTKYLSENNINYEFVKSENIAEIKKEIKAAP